MDEKYSILGTTLKGIADAIRRKTGKTGGLVPENMEAEIDSVKTFDDLPELSNPAGAAQILSGFEAILADGSKVTGTISSQAAQTITPGTSNKTIEAGKYLSGTQTIKGDSNLKEANILKGVSIFGVTGSASSAVAGVYAPTADATTATISDLKNKSNFILLNIYNMDPSGVIAFYYTGGTLKYMTIVASTVPYTKVDVATNIGASFTPSTGVINAGSLKFFKTYNYAYAAW